MYYTGLAMYRLNRDKIIIEADEFEYDLELIVTSSIDEINRFKKKHKKCKLCLVVLSESIPEEIGQIVQSAKEFLDSKEKLGIRIN